MLKEPDYLHNYVKSTHQINSIINRGKTEIRQIKSKNLHQKQIDRLVKENIRVHDCFNMFD